MNDTLAPQIPRGKIQLGQAGELLAAAYLCACGMQICRRNVALSKGEIDIIAQQNKTYIFIEVRTIAASEQFSPIDSIGRKKRKKVRQNVKDYLQLTGMPEDTDIRLDVIGVHFSNYEVRIEHYPNAL
jgi:putative endonuclease